jgi:phosphoenolpyruvate-protein kinase (PTS system EI component)
VSVCGEAAADPAAAALLVGLGVTELSVAPAAITGLRTTLARLDPTACREAARSALSASTVDQVRALAIALVGQHEARVERPTALG